jgi:putative ABC transport system permease protein
MSNLWLDIRYGVRSMFRTPVFTLTVILTLAIGIGANTAMFGILNTALFRPLPFPEPDRLVFGHTSWNGSGSFALVSAPDYWDYRDHTQAFSSLAAVGFSTEVTVTGRGDPERVVSAAMSVDMLPTLGVRPQPGRNFSAAEAKPDSRVVLISNGYWMRRLGGARDIIGQALVLNGNPQTVVGVTPAGFRLTDDVDVWFPMADDAGSHLARRFHNWFLVGRLKPGATLTEARSQVDVISKRLTEDYPESNENKALGLVTLHDYYVNDDRASLLALMGAVALVLLIACANVAGLLLARGATRRHEFGIRSALGASRGRLTGQLLTESMAIALISAGGGVLLAGWLQQVLLQVTPLDSLGVRGTQIDSTVLLFALGLSLATAVLFGMAPAFRGGQVNPAADLRPGARTTETRSGSRLRTVLAVGQISLSLVLLAGSGLLIRSMLNLQRTDLGFNPDNLLTAELQLPSSSYPESEERARFHRAFLKNVRALPGVQAASVINLLPVREPRNNTAVWAFGKELPEINGRNSAFIRMVMPGYFETMEIPLLAGRTIEERDQTDTTEVAVINEELAGVLYPDANPVGRKFVIDWPGNEPEVREIVGVVGNVRLQGLGGRNVPAFYAPYPQVATGTVQLAVRAGGDPNLLVGPLRAALKEMDQDIPLSGALTMKQFIGRSLTDRRIVTGLLLVFASIAVVLAALGLYGVLAFYVGRHVHEIGVRMALGASVREVLLMVVGRGMRVVGVGLGIGIVGSFAAVRLIGHLLYGVPAADPLTLAVAVGFFALVALLACLIPARRATQVDPALTLRSE